MTAPQLRWCIGEHGDKHLFEFYYDAALGRVLAYVPGHYDEHIFELNLDLEGEVRINIMNYGSFFEYARLGIPEQAIAFASEAVGRAIYSNPVHVENIWGNSRAEVATKVWRRLVALGGATYDDVSDRFQSTRLGAGG